MNKACFDFLSNISRFEHINALEQLNSKQNSLIIELERTLKSKQTIINLKDDMINQLLRKK